MELQKNENIFDESNDCFYLDGFFGPISKEVEKEEDHNIQKFLLKMEFCGVCTKKQFFFEN